MEASGPDGIKASRSHSMRWVQQSGADGFCPCNSLLHHFFLARKLLQHLCIAQPGADCCSGRRPHLPACKGVSQTKACISFRGSADSS